ncbi:MAG: DUF2892 domain-containing protein [Bacteroidetes bacterium]|nr:DUF2892 domain-containing protein [Bacteroidota bacterium]
MKKNVGVLDKIIRLIIAAAIAYFIYSNVLIGVWAIVEAVVGAIMLLTALLECCGLYTVFGIKTCCAKSH